MFSKRLFHGSIDTGFVWVRAKRRGSGAKFLCQMGAVLGMVA
jgi:hypothetical protein